MILYSDFEYSGDVGSLVSYMERNQGEAVPVKTPDGRVLSEAEKARFVERSRENSFERHLVLSPDPDAEFAEREIDRRTREVVREWVADKPSVEAVYCVHQDQPSHAHVAATGAKRDLAMYPGDLKAFEERAAERFREPQRVQQRERRREAERVLERNLSNRERQLHREAQLPKDDHGDDQDQERDRDPERDYW